MKLLGCRRFQQLVSRERCCSNISTRTPNLILTRNHLTYVSLPLASTPPLPTPYYAARLLHTACIKCGCQCLVSLAHQRYRASGCVRVLHAPLPSAAATSHRHLSLTRSSRSFSPSTNFIELGRIVALLARAREQQPVRDVVVAVRAAAVRWAQAHRRAAPRPKGAATPRRRRRCAGRIVERGALAFTCAAPAAQLLRCVAEASGSRRELPVEPRPIIARRDGERDSWASAPQHHDGAEFRRSVYAAARGGNCERPRLS